MRKKFYAILIVAIVLAGSLSLYKYNKYYKEPAPQAIDLSEILRQSEVAVISTSQKKSSNSDIKEVTPLSELPSELKNLNIDMPFYPQAPYANWALPWQEACEEASVLLIANIYFKNNWSKKQFNDEILKLVNWQNKRFGYYEHTNVRDTAIMLNEYLGLKTIIHENPNFDLIKKTLQKGHLIIMTFAGKKLGNPFYKNGGPIYHAMVIKGFKEGDKIVTHDVGTRRGENYVYKWSVIENAMHDFAMPIEKGAKRMIEVLPPNI